MKFKFTSAFLSLSAFIFFPYSIYADSATRPQGNYGNQSMDLINSGVESDAFTPTIRLPVKPKPKPKPKPRPPLQTDLFPPLEDESVPQPQGGNLSQQEFSNSNSVDANPPAPNYGNQSMDMYPNPRGACAMIARVCRDGSAAEMHPINRCEQVCPEDNPSEEENGTAAMR